MKRVQCFVYRALLAFDAVIMQTIGWISPEMRQIVGVVNDFPRVYQPSYRDELKLELSSSIASI